jgi:hypothetical protein
VTIIEYASMSRPHCAAFEELDAKLKTLLKKPASGLPLRWRLQFANQPTDIAGLHWIRRYRDFFDVIAPGAIERAKFKSSGPRRDARKRHARLALWAAKSLNGKQRDYGWIIGHGLHLKIWRERKTLGHR